jgi:nicotinamidase-related amidase
MDCQSTIVSIYTEENQDALLGRAAGVLNHARASHMTVIHVEVGFRSGLPEVSTQNQLMGPIKGSAQHQKLFQEPLGSIHPTLAPAENEIVITKHRVSAFTGSDLAMILRAIHNTLIEKLFPSRATVFSAADFLNL